MTCELRASAERLGRQRGLVLTACPYEKANVCDDTTAAICPEISGPLPQNTGQIEKFEMRNQQRGRKFLEMIGRR